MCFRLQRKVSSNDGKFSVAKKVCVLLKKEEFCKTEMFVEKLEQFHWNYKFPQQPKMTTCSNNFWCKKIKTLTTNVPS